MELIKTETLEEKLLFLSESTEYDVCGPERCSYKFNQPQESEGAYSFTLFQKEDLKTNLKSFIYKAKTSSGYTSLLKILMTNKCDKNCLYCINRRARNTRRIQFKPEELAKIFMDMAKASLVDGLFLSSGVYNSSSKTMDEMLKTVSILRNIYKFKGYIHLKILPEALTSQIEEAIKISNRVSINLEAPTPLSLLKIAPEKKFYEDIMSVIKTIRHFENSGLKVKSGLTTQFIAGIGEERDCDFLKTSDLLYKDFNLKRAYFSRFEPVKETPFENKNPASMLKEVRLYQADFLMRLYGFSLDEIPFNEGGNLSNTLDPKEDWARKHEAFFPVDLDKASYEELIRVPGIGLKGAKKIIDERRKSNLSHDNLKKLIVLKRAHSYILLKGKKVKYNKEPEYTLFDSMV